MSHQTFKMSLGFIAVAAVALMLAGNASASVTISGTDQGAVFTSAAGGTSPDIRNNTTLNGTFNQTGGAVTGSVRFGYGTFSAAGETNIWNMSGGTASTTSFHMMSEGAPYASGCSGLLSISAGTFTATSDIQIGGGAKATVAVSGTGTYDQTSGAPWINADTHYEVTGGTATMNLKDVYFQGAGSQTIGGLKFTLTNSTGRIATIWDKGTSYNFDLSNAGNAGKIDIVEATPGLVTIGQKFDLLKIDQGLNIMVPGAGANSLLDAGDTAAWSLAVVSNKNSSGFDVLELTALTPEPATMALLAIGGLGMLIRRRRR